MVPEQLFLLIKNNEFKKIEELLKSNININLDIYDVN